MKYNECMIKISTGYDIISFFINAFIKWEIKFQDFYFLKSTPGIKYYFYLNNSCSLFRMQTNIIVLLYSNSKYSL